MNDCECVMCDEAYDFQDFWNRTLEIINTVGWSVIGIPDGEPAFSYTVGNSAVNLPELLVIGPQPHNILGVINHLSKMQRDREHPFADGEIISLGGKFPVKAIIAGDKKEEYATLAYQFAKSENVDVIQILVPDRNGRFPGDPDCAEPFCNCPVLRKLSS